MQCSTVLLHKDLQYFVICHDVYRYGCNMYVLLQVKDVSAAQHTLVSWTVPEKLLRHANNYSAVKTIAKCVTPQVCRHTASHELQLKSLYQLLDSFAQQHLLKKINPIAYEGLSYAFAISHPTVKTQGENLFLKATSC